MAALSRRRSVSHCNATHCIAGFFNHLFIGWQLVNPMLGWQAGSSPSPPHVHYPERKQLQTATAQFYTFTTCIFITLHCAFSFPTLQYCWGSMGERRAVPLHFLFFFSPFLPCLQNVYASMQTSAEVGYYRGESEREGGRETGTKRGDGKGVSERLREAVDASER